MILLYYSLLFYYRENRTIPINWLLNAAVITKKSKVIQSSHPFTNIPILETIQMENVNEYIITIDPRTDLTNNQLLIYKGTKEEGSINIYIIRSY